MPREKGFGMRIIDIREWKWQPINFCSRWRSRLRFGLNFGFGFHGDLIRRDFRIHGGGAAASTTAAGSEE